MKKRRQTAAKFRRIGGFSKHQMFAVIVGLVLVGLVAFLSHASSLPDPRATLPRPRPGWIKATAGPCAGLFESTLFKGECSHGPDKFAATTGTSVLASGPFTSVPCVGDGHSGYRIMVIYLRDNSTAPLLNASVVTDITTTAVNVANILASSAAETGGQATPRFLTRPLAGGGCQLVIREYDQIGNLELARHDRGKFILHDDGTKPIQGCGIGGIHGDDSVHYVNTPKSAEVWRGSDYNCWLGIAPAHELIGHNMGAVQDSAPHASHKGHCWDSSDLMCYNDGGSYFQNGGVLHALCSTQNKYDCNHDDYFYAGTPPPDNYLASHWNNHYSSLLDGANLRDTKPPSAPTKVAVRVVNPKRVRVMWNADSSDDYGVNGYDISRDGESINAVSPTEGTDVLGNFFWEDPSAEPGATYTYSVRALDWGNNYSAPASVTVVVPPPDTTAPLTPTLVSTNQDSSTIWLTFSSFDSDYDGVTRFKLFRNGSLIYDTNTTNASYFFVASVPVSGPGIFNDSKLQPNTAYTYSVIAFDGSGNASPPASLTVRTTNGQTCIANNSVCQ